MITLRSAQGAAARVPGVVWQVLGVVAAMLIFYEIGHWRGHRAGITDAKHEAVEHALKDNAQQLGPAIAHSDTAKKKAERMVHGADSTRARFANARARVVVENDSTVVDTAMHQVLTSPLLVQVVREADAMKTQDSLTIETLRENVHAVEVERDLWKARAQLLEQDNAILRDEHKPLLGSVAGILGGVAVGAIGVLTLVAIF